MRFTFTCRCCFGCFCCTTTIQCALACPSPYRSLSLDMWVSVWLIVPSLVSIPVYLALECQHTHTHTSTHIYSHDHVRRWLLCTIATEALHSTRPFYNSTSTSTYIHQFHLRYRHRRYAERPSDLFFLCLFVCCLDASPGNIYRYHALCCSLCSAASGKTFTRIFVKRIWCERNTGNHIMWFWAGRIMCLFGNIELKFFSELNNNVVLADDSCRVPTCCYRCSCCHWWRRSARRRTRYMTHLSLIFNLFLCLSVSLPLSLSPFRSPSLFLHLFRA